MSALGASPLPVYVCVCMHVCMHGCMHACVSVCRRRIAAATSRVLFASRTAAS